ncbi:nucleoside ABC transporter membrane protein [Rhodobacter viridis]|uniref:Nucleoside ABC transporter membrane protein n=1 Tax=Rhodobacter viridis TaxID=1054202 RepID=A0A318UDU5_9RHOB|nr:ABC transporter permease [Rhodobacter viridis]PYF10687.1 nucleoside ABC transporter membrane protein [Rhodobacter viridis]
MIGGIDIVTLIAALMAASTPVLLAATGELVAEKAGVLNLGVEGMMIVGAVAGFATAVTTGSPVLGFAGGALAAALMASLFALLTQVFLSNQTATGLALTLFGLGLSALAGKGFEGVRPPPTGKVPFGPLADLPVVGPIVFGHDWMVYVSLALVAAVWAFLKYARLGLILRAVGENHDAAHALGYRVIAVRFAALAFGGALAGLGGAYLSLVRVPQWTEGMTAGAGWIALAIVVFASWRAERVLIGAYLFGGITALQLQLQAAGYAIPVHFLSMAPYVITVLVLVVLSATHRYGAPAAPAALGRTFHASN